jgi:hypothetical protein
MYPPHAAYPDEPTNIVRADSLAADDLIVRKNFDSAAARRCHRGLPIRLIASESLWSFHHLSSGLSDSARSGPVESARSRSDVDKGLFVKESVFFCVVSNANSAPV